MLLDHYYVWRHTKLFVLALLLTIFSERPQPVWCSVTHRQGTEQGTSGSGSDGPRNSGSDGQQDGSHPVTGCAACWTRENREERRQLDRQAFQEKILQKLRMSQPPNFSEAPEDIHLIPSIQNIISELEQEDRTRRGSLPSIPSNPTEQDLPIDVSSSWKNEELGGDGESSTVFTAFLLAENNLPNDPNVLKFDLGQYSDPDLLVSAVLGVHVTGTGQHRRNLHTSFTSSPARTPQQETGVVITLYRRITLDTPHQPGNYLNEFLQKGRRKLLRQVQNTWQSFDITAQVFDWIRHPHTNLGLSLEVLDQRRRPLNILDLDCSNTSEHRPYLELQFRDPDSTPPSLRPHSRTRRTITTSQDCQENTPQSMCCRYYLEIDFAAIGWGDWIIAPQRTSAYYCSGACPYLYQTVLPAGHLGQQSGLLPGAPCCAPTKTSPLKIMYRGANGTFLQSILPGLIVDKCGCW